MERADDPYSQNEFTIKDSLTCAQPSDMQGLKLAEITQEDFICLFPGEDPDNDGLFSGLDCPQSCMCSYAPYNNETRIVCHKQGLTSLPEALPMVPSTNYLALDLSDNSLRDIHGVKQRYARNFNSIRYRIRNPVVNKNMSNCWNASAS